MAEEFRIGVKSYDHDWFLKYGLSPQDAAELLEQWGVSFVLARSCYLPMPNSAVKSETTSQSSKVYTKGIDLQFRAALAQRGIQYWATVCTFFNPSAVSADPRLRPIGSDGQPMEQIDWYIGIAPSQDEYVTDQLAQIRSAVHALQPDGIFLSFTRWPGFWELWMPHHQRQDFPEYSYDTKTLERFQKDTCLDLPTLEPVEAARWIEANARKSWTNWKCKLVADFIRQVKAIGRQEQPYLKIMLNTIPFRAQEYDGAREKVFGQDIEMLSKVVDAFEVMTYHQILKRQVGWIPAAGLEVKQRSGAKTICTIQSKPLYLEGIHAKEKRSAVLDDQEFIKAVDAMESASLDGMVVFTWSNLLEEVFQRGNMSWVAALKSAVKRREMRTS
jgi:hypothetical protein